MRLRGRRRCHRNRSEGALLPRLHLPRRVSSFLLFVLILPQILLAPNAPPRLHASASGILADLASSAYDSLFPPEDHFDDDFETKTLNIVEISEMRARDIKRRLARRHGYDAEELSKMIDKKDLINALSYEEHKVYLQESDRRKWIRFKRTVIYTCVAVTVVMFWPLVRHAIEVAHVNFVFYSDRRKHEISRCRDYNSFKGYFGIFLLFVIDFLSLWLSVSVLGSWVMRSKWFFPVPNLPIRPAQLLTPAGGDAGALGKYGINVGPMLISWLFRFLNGKVEGMIGRAMSDALKREKKKEKDKIKQLRKEERAREKEARREARRQAKKAKEERMARKNNRESESEDEEVSEGENSYCGMTASNVTGNAMPSFEDLGASSFDDLD